MRLCWHICCCLHPFHKPWLLQHLITPPVFWCSGSAATLWFPLHPSGEVPRCHGSTQSVIAGVLLQSSVAGPQVRGTVGRKPGHPRTTCLMVSSLAWHRGQAVPRFTVNLARNTHLLSTPLQASCSKPLPLELSQMAFFGESDLASTVYRYWAGTVVFALCFARKCPTRTFISQKRFTKNTAPCISNFCEEFNHYWHLFQKALYDLLWPGAYIFMNSLIQKLCVFQNFSAFYNFELTGFYCTLLLKIKTSRKLKHMLVILPCLHQLSTMAPITVSKLLAQKSALLNTLQISLAKLDDIMLLTYFST